MYGKLDNYIYYICDYCLLFSGDMYNSGFYLRYKGQTEREKNHGEHIGQKFIVKTAMNVCFYRNIYNSNKTLEGK